MDCTPTPLPETTFAFFAIALLRGAVEKVFFLVVVDQCEMLSQKHLSFFGNFKLIFEILRKSVSPKRTAKHSVHKSLVSS